MTQPQEPTVKQKSVILSLERGMDACCCLFLAAALLLALYKPLAQGSALPGAFIYLPAIFLLFAFFCDRRLLASLAFCAILILLFCYLNDVPWLISAPDFIRWWAAGFTPVNADFVRYYYVVVRLSLALTVTLGLWLLIRRHPPFWLLLAGCPAVVAVVAYFGLRGFVLSIYLLAAGLIPLSAAAMVKHNQKERGRASAYALCITTLILGAVFLILPTDTSGWRWTPLGDKVEEWRETARVYYWTWRTKNEPMTAFDLSEEYHTRLGGPIKPGNIRMLMVKTNQPLLLRGSVYDYYTGHSWTKSSIYFNTPFPRANDDYENFSVSANAVPFTPASTADELQQILGVIPAPESDHPLAPFARRFSLEITLLHPQEPRLFYGGRPDSFATADAIEPFLERDAELKSRLPLYNGCRYELEGLSLDRTMPGFAAAMADSSNIANMPEQAVNRLDIIETGLYRQLPVSMVLDRGYSVTYQLAQEIVNAGLSEGESRSPYEQALLLESWLKNNCSYTLTPVEPPDDMDFVMHFLETREGYCTYYATAMVIMARTLDLRARYVTGYSLKPTRGANQYEATQSTAHAWAELFFEGVGWLPFDPTGMEADNSLSTGGLSEPELVIDEPLHWATWGNTTTTNRATDYHTLWVIALTLVSVALLIILLLLRQAWLAYRLPKLLKRFSPAAVLDIYYSNLLDQLVMLGWQRRPAETILRFMRRMGAYLPKQALQLQELSVAVCAWRYGALPPDEDSLLNAAALHEHFDSMLKRQLKGGKYIAYRIRHGFHKLFTRHP